MGRHEDQVWQLVYRYADGKRWLCLHCGKSYAGNASKVKFHLAKIPFQGIAICERVPQEYQGIAYALIPAKGKNLKLSVTIFFPSSIVANANSIINKYYIILKGIGIIL